MRHAQAPFITPYRVTPACVHAYRLVSIQCHFYHVRQTHVHHSLLIHADDVARFLIPSVSRLAAWAGKGIMLRQGPLPAVYEELLQHAQVAAVGSYKQAAAATT